MKNLVILIVIFLSGGCAASSTIFRSPVTHEVIEDHIEKSPIIEYLAEERFGPTEKESIDLYFKFFHFLNSPDVIVNWRFYYVLGEPSSPEFKYRKIAKVEIYLRSMNDNLGKDTLKEAASSIGANALIDVYKKPISKPDTTKRAGYNMSETPIDAYLYYGIAVRQK